MDFDEVLDCGKLLAAMLFLAALLVNCGGGGEETIVVYETVAAASSTGTSTGGATTGGASSGGATSGGGTTGSCVPDGVTVDSWDPNDAGPCCTPTEDCPTRGVAKCGEAACPCTPEGQQLKIRPASYLWPMVVIQGECCTNLAASYENTSANAPDDAGFVLFTCEPLCTSDAQCPSNSCADTEVNICITTGGQFDAGEFVGCCTPPGA